MDDRGVAEAEVHRRRADDTVQGAVERLDAVLARGLRPRLKVRLVELDDVGPGDAILGLAASGGWRESICADDYTDLGAGATYQSTWLEVTAA